jgi:hypothetical protein
VESDHDNGWSPFWVVLNTTFTMLGGLAGGAALVIALIALFR